MESNENTNEESEQNSVEHIVDRSSEDEPIKTILNQPDELRISYETMDMKGVIIESKKGVENVIIELLQKAMEQEYFDSILIPYMVPNGESFVYLLIHDPKLLANSSPLAPVMPVQGARALSSVTRLGNNGKKLAAVLRPCEVRAAVELSKLGQIDLNGVTLISMDCPGVVSTKIFNEDPKSETEKFKNLLHFGTMGKDDKKNKSKKEVDHNSLREMCKSCDKAYSIFGDLHFGYVGIDNDLFLLIQRTIVGNELLETISLNADTSIDDWQKATNDIANLKRNKRSELVKELENNRFGLDNLLQTFSACLKCHNCMRACPIDYCQLCYFESDDMKHTAEEYFSRARSNIDGSLRFPTDTLQYHLGRMLHMSMSCVACGTCEDTCPMSIPVAQIYSIVGQNVQDLFNYTSGENTSEPIPLSTNQEEEFTEMES